MVDSRKITVEPLTFRMTGFTVEELFSKDFIVELKRDLPTAVVAHFAIGFSDSKEVVMVSHDRQEGQIILERIDVEGTEAKLTGRMVEVLKRVLA